MARPKVPLISKREVVRTALEVIDTEGVQALTIRRLGAELNVNGASLYHHFSNKKDILLAVGRAVLADIQLPDESVRGIDWIVQLAKEERRVLRDHPEMIRLLGRGYLRISTVPGYRRTTELLTALKIPAEHHGAVIDMIQSLIVGSVLMLQMPSEPLPESASDGAGADATERMGPIDDDHLEDLFELSLRALLKTYRRELKSSG